MQRVHSASLLPGLARPSPALGRASRFLSAAEKEVLGLAGLGSGIQRVSAARTDDPAIARRMD